MMPQVPEALLIARRRIEEFTNVELINDWQWDSKNEQWYVLLRLTISVEETEYLPLKTDWYVLVPPTYPWGKIEFNPAQKSGLTTTFQHQSHNNADENELWRNGNLCITPSISAITRAGHRTTEPFDVEDRLFWYLERALLWLDAAAMGQLCDNGDPFEIPHYPKSDLSCLAYVENQKTFSTWRQCNISYGCFEYYQLNDKPETSVVIRFGNKNNLGLIDVKWGTAITNQAKQASLKKGIWIKLSKVPVFSPWHAPTTWGELQRLALEQDVDILNCIKETAALYRDEKQHILAIGFPIPNKIGESPRQLFWIALKLPVLTSRKCRNGFPKHKLWERDLLYKFKDSDKLQWIFTENWDLRELSSRGCFDTVVAANKLLVIGGGAIGSMVGEQLIRGGNRNICFIDDDKLKTGNLLRHTLNLHDVGRNKANQLASKGNFSLPHANVDYISRKFPPRNEADEEKIHKCNVIIDCSADDTLLASLSQFDWKREKLFISVSTNIGATRLFLFTYKGYRFPCELYFEMIQPFLRDDLERYDELDIQREGIGCWHPVYPARIDDVSLLASIATKYIEETISLPPEKISFKVFEQQKEEGIFTGVKLICQEERDAVL